MESVRSKSLLKLKGHHPGLNRRTLDHKPSVIPMSYCGRERPRANSNNMILHDFYVILWAHPEISGSIPTLVLGFLFSSQTAPRWLFYLFANFNDSRSKLSHFERSFQIQIRQQSLKTIKCISERSSAIN